MGVFKFKSTLLAVLVAIYVVKAQDGSLDTLIDSVFTKEPPKDSMKCGENSECVPYYLCEGGVINTDGSGLLDIRFGEEKDCLDYFEQCCDIGKIIPKNGTHNYIEPDDPHKGQITGTPTVAPPTGPPTVGPPIGHPKGHEGCGYRNVDGVGFRITGNSDHESEYGEFPWMMAILKEESAAQQVLNVYQCGGTLIHPNVVLTAAHCVHGKPASAFKVRGGEWDTQTKNEVYDHYDRDVIDVVTHKDYYKGGLHNDVALLFLKDPMPIEEHINVACLPPQNFNFDHNRCFASGWGKDLFGKDGKYQVILKKIELPVVPHTQCETAMRGTRLGKRFNLHNSFICAGGEPGKDTCKGDGGSPLVCPIPGTQREYYQAGMVAWGIGCGENGVPGVYVNVPLFRDWIDQQVRNHGYDTSAYTHN